MSGRTPKLDLTVPDVNDYIAAWPEIAEQGFLDLENSLIIDARVAADAHDAYPIGMSLFGLTSSGATDGGWPTGSGMVISWRRPLGDQTFQFKVSQGVARGPNVYARSGASGGWSPWSVAASRELPVAVASGSVTLSDVASGATVEQEVAFPSAVFTAAPVVTLTPQANYPEAWAIALSAAPTATSLKFRAKRLGEGSGSVVVYWQASQPGV